MRFPYIGAFLSGTLPVKYIWTTFTATSERDLWVWSSPDATTWDLVKGPAYTPGTILRDPSILHTQDGTYYVTYTTGWFSTNFAIITSKNLLTWTPHTTVEITNTSITRTWAPELWRDPTTGKTHIIVSLGTNHPDFTTNLYTATDDTLAMWEGPVLMRGIPENYIDTFVVYKDGMYHAFTKGVPYLEHAVAKKIEGPYKLVQTGDFAGWGEMEGPCVVKLEEGWYRIWGDRYREGTYIYSDSWDLYNWTAPKEVKRLSGVVRHGTVIKVE